MRVLISSIIIWFAAAVLSTAEAARYKAKPRTIKSVKDRARVIDRMLRKPQLRQRVVDYFTQYFFEKSSHEAKAIKYLLTAPLDAVERYNKLATFFGNSGFSRPEIRQATRKHEDRWVWDAGILFSKEIEPLLPKKMTRMKVLDIGCGKGTILAELSKHLKGDFGGKRRQVETYGIDFKPIAANTGVRLEQYDKNGRIPFGDRTIQTVTMNMAGHHIKKLDHVLQEAYRVLAPGGVLVLRETDGNSGACRLLNTGMEVLHTMSRRDGSNEALYVHHRPAVEWANALKARGFELKSARRWHCDAGGMANAFVVAAQKPMQDGQTRRE